MSGAEEPCKRANPCHALRSLDLREIPFRSEGRQLARVADCAPCAGEFTGKLARIANDPLLREQVSIQNEIEPNPSGPIVRTFSCDEMPFAIGSIRIN